MAWEIGNAFSAMFKQIRLSLDEAKNGLTIFKSIPLRFIETNFFNTISLAIQTNMYAYDAYFLDCAIRFTVPLLTLDRRLKKAAQNLGIKTLEV